MCGCVCLHTHTHKTSTGRVQESVLKREWQLWGLTHTLIGLCLLVLLQMLLAPAVTSTPARMFTLDSTVLQRMATGNSPHQTAGVFAVRPIYTVLLLRRCACSTESTPRARAPRHCPALCRCPWCMGGWRVQQPQFRPLLTLHAPALMRGLPALILARLESHATFL